MSPVKETSPGLLFAIDGMRVTHSDNHSQLLSMAPVVKVAATISNVASQVAAVAVDLSFILTCFTFVALTNVTAYLTPVCANFASISANLPSIASNLRLGGNSSKSNECCTRKNCFEHWVSDLKCRFAWLSVTPSA